MVALRRGVVLLLFGWLVAGSVSQAGAKTEEEAFIRSLADQAIAVLSDESMSLEDREAHLRDLLYDNFALDKIGPFVIGREWRRMNEAQRADYQQLFGEWTLRTYAKRLGGYSGQKFEILETVPAGETKDVFVRTKVASPGSSQDFRVDWRVSRIKGEMKIVDVVVEGVSMLVTTRSDFASVVNRRGVNGLIEMLRSRVTKYEAVSG